MNTSTSSSTIPARARSSADRSGAESPKMSSTEGVGGCLAAGCSRSAVDTVTVKVYALG